eukprot:TRINITY_DN13494_c0_g1_i1.p1 TRINITY_DN13494_c0_g1~~TRINITY_DN13494_c0_g1_i1.p1  ORF type:complete len:462 (-),score=102.16 TRINITY_DN13494_c0_g1_i1:55-1404(-)
MLLGEWLRAREVTAGRRQQRRAPRYALLKRGNGVGGAAAARRPAACGGHVAAVMDLQYADCADVPLLVSCDAIGQVRLWHTEGRKLLGAIRNAHVGSVNSIGVMHVSPCFITGSDDTRVKLWDPASVSAEGAQPVSVFNGHSSFVTSCACTTDTHIFATCSLDATIRLWDPRTANHVFLFNAHSPARTVSFVPNTATLLVTASPEGVMMWDVRAHPSFVEAFNTTPSLPSCTQMSFPQATPEAKTVRRRGLATPSPNPISTFWHFGALVSPTPQRKENAAMWWDEPCAVYSAPNLPPKKLLFDRKTKRYEQAFAGHAGPCFCARVTHDGKHLLSSSATDNTHKLWDVCTRRGSFTLDGADLGHHTAPALSADDCFTLCGSADGSLHVWETFAGADPGCKVTPRGNCCALLPAVHPFAVTANCWMPDDVGVVSGDTSGTIQCAHFTKSKP